MIDMILKRRFIIYHVSGVLLNFTEPEARLLGDPLSAKLCDLFGRLGCFLLFVRCAFYYGTIFIIFIGAHSSGFRGTKWSCRSCRPMTHHPHHFSEAVNRTALGLYIYVDMDMDMHIQAGSNEYAHLLFYLACSHFAATICRHNKLPIIFSFHISVIDFASRLWLHASMKCEGDVCPARQLSRKFISNVKDSLFYQSTDQIV